MRIGNLGSRIGGLKPLVARQTDAHGHSRAREPWRAWYNEAAWCHPERGLRIRTFMRDNFTCQWKGCGLVLPPRQLRADHKRPHRGDRRLFFAPGNVWTLCQPHHDSAKQAEERRGLWDPPPGG